VGAQPERKAVPARAAAVPASICRRERWGEGFMSLLRDLYLRMQESITSM
jgi:hypothetical protein